MHYQMLISLDYGKTWTEAKQGVRLILSTPETGEEIHLAVSHEGIIADLYESEDDGPRTCCLDLEWLRERCA